MAVGNQSTPVPAPGTPPAAPTPAAGTQPVPAAPTTAAPAATVASTATTHHTTWREHLSGRSGFLIISLSLIGGYLFGMYTWHRKSQAWYFGWACIVLAMVILVIWFWDWWHRPATPCESSTIVSTTTTAAPAATTSTPAPPAPPPTPCTPPLNTPYTLNGRVWITDGTNTWVKDASDAWVLVP